MADIRLAKPAAGTTQTVPSAPDGRFIFDFPADAATLTRSGDNLVLTFEDGASIQLQDFYTTYSKEEMPSFQVEGVEISGQDFFAALGEDLMPAAGPAAGSSASRSGRYNEYGGSDLLDGLDHLGRLDIGFDGGVQLATDTVEPSPYYEDDHGVTVTPSAPGTDSDDPDIPVQGEDFPPTMPHDVLQVDESALDGGSGGGSATADGSMSVSAPDGVATITIGGVVVWQNGALTGNPVQTDEGHLDVTGFDGTNLTYTYTLDKATQEHAEDGADKAIAHEMEVVVTDSDGDSGSAVIRVEITDDVPTIESFGHDVTEGSSTVINGDALEGSAAGADGADFAWTNPAQQGQYGTITLNEDGTYTYTLDNDNAAVKELSKDETLTEEFTYTYTDADGDVDTGTVTITINGVDNGVVVTPSDPEAGSETLTVYESGLADGSTPGEKPTTAEGSMNIDAPDGVASIVIGGVTVFENGALTSNTVPTDEGVLTVTGFDAATGELKFTYTLNDNTLEHNTGATDTQVSHNLAVTVTDVDNSTATSTITVTIVDDEPSISVSDMSSTVVPGSGAGNLADGEAADFTKGTGGQSLGHSDGLDGWSGVTMYAAKVTYSGSGNDVQISRIDGDGNYTLKYSPYKGNPEFTSSDWGLTVDAGNYDEYGNYDSDANHNEEISVIKDAHGNANQSEAVVFDLGGQLAYGVTIDFGAFYNGKPGAEGTTQWDHVSEKALVTFYRDGEIVGSTIVEGNSSTGTFTLNSSDVVLGGFDKVVISAVDNRTDEYWDEHSDFTIQGIDFITKRDDPFIVSEGKVTAESGADGFADAYADSHVQFDLAGMVNEDSLSEDGTSGTITVLVDGQPTDVTLTLREGASGDSILTGTLPGGEQLFTATLDKDGNWTMEQYDQFRIPGEEGQESSNKFDLVFKTEDADGDMTSTTVNVPLEVVDQTINADNEAVSNGNDTIVITGGDGIAGTVAAGDSGGVEVQTTVQPGQDYNISIMLDLSGSMADPLHSDTNTSRIEMAVDALKNFFETSLQNHDGDISLQLVGFGTDVLGTRTWTIDGDAFDAEKQQVYDEFANQLSAWQKKMNSWGYRQGTNYEAAMEKATEWFSKDTAEGGVADNGGENLAFFISDGQPTYYYDGTNLWGDPKVKGEGNYSNQETVRQTLEAAQDLQNAGSGVKVNAIGIGTDTSLNENAQTILDLIDNTGGSEQNVASYPYQTHDSDKAWTNDTWYGDRPLVEGDSDLVNSEDDLTAALVGGGVITSTDLADAGNDTITAEDSDSSVIIYGDVMNTDRLLYELKQLELSNLVMAGAVVSALPDYGSGTQVFQWLEDNSANLKGDYAGWTHDDTLKYMLEHAEELGYETRVDGNGEFYLVTADGTVLNMDGTEANVGLDSLTGRGGGNDTIIGSQADDVIYGQEGNDLLVGDAPSESGEGSTVGSIEGTTVASIKAMDTDGLDAFIQSVEGTDADGDDRLFGGTGDDVLLGMGGDDYIDGGAGEDAIFGGRGNDIIVYDSNDYLVSGGSGIDFMVSDNSTLTLTELLSGGKDGKDGPIVDSIEVLLKGDAALSLTSIQDLADRYGITLGTNADGQETLTLDMSKWNESIPADGTHVFTSTDNDLTLETNLQHDAASSSDNGEMAQQVFILENTNS